ncbi:MAG: hypothetical protein Q7S56_04120 [Nanoarchaeota archaeon]|nr:hypothetical protein [Nanoarchaeota archaeon]
MEKKSLILINQLIQIIEIVLPKLESAYEGKDANKFNSYKKIIVDSQDKIAKEMENE